MRTPQRAPLLLVLISASCVTGPKPVMPPIYDTTIVFGQRVGPVSLGMSESQLDKAVGKPTSNVDYTGFQTSGPNRRGFVYNKRWELAQLFRDVLAVPMQYTRAGHVQSLSRGCDPASPQVCLRCRRHPSRAHLIWVSS